MFLHNFFYPSVQLIFTAFYFQVITFSFVNFCFVTLYFHLRRDQTKKRLSKILIIQLNIKEDKNFECFFRITISLFCIFWAFLTVNYLFGILIEPIYCRNFFGWQWDTFSASSLLISISCGIFGFILLR